MSKPILTFPCKYQPNDLEKRSDSHFCQACDKSIIDYRQKTEEEIHQSTSSSASNTCGIFHSHQLTHATTIIPIGLHRKIGLSLLGILGMTSPIVSSSCETKPPETEAIQQFFSKLKFPLFLRGKIVDKSSKEPISLGTVSVTQGTKVLLSGKTNEKGEFMIPIHENDLSDPDFELVLGGFGYLPDTLFHANNWRKLPLEIQLETIPYERPTALKNNAELNRKNSKIDFSGGITLGFFAPPSKPFFTSFNCNNQSWQLNWMIKNYEKR